MAQAEPIAILFPLLVGVVATIATIGVHTLAVNSIIYFVRRERRLGRVGPHFLPNILLVSTTILIALTAHLLSIGIWAWVLELCGEFTEGGIAFYHSAVNYTSLGYGDIVMSSRWKLLGPIEAADGLLMFGLSTAMVFAVMQRLILIRFKDLAD
jgi:Ion channel